MYTLDKYTKLKFELILFTLHTHQYGTEDFYDQLVHLIKIANRKLFIPLDCSFICYNTVLQSSDIDSLTRTMALLDFITHNLTISNKGLSLLNNPSDEVLAIASIYNTSYKNEICTFDTCLAIEHPTYMNCTNCKNLTCEKQSISLIELLKKSTSSLLFKSYSSS